MVAKLERGNTLDWPLALEQTGEAQALVPLDIRRADICSSSTDANIRRLIRMFPGKVPEGPCQNARFVSEMG